MVGMITADDLLALSGGDAPGPHRTTVDGLAHIDVPAAMLADLHHPELIITSDYVGPARGRPARQGQGGEQGRGGDRKVHDLVQRDSARPGNSAASADRGGAREPSPAPIRPVVVAVVLTAATMAPLTLVLSHWVAH